MRLSNTPDRWGAVPQLLHWMIALMVIVLALVGLLMQELPNSPTKLQVYGLHKSFGLTVLALVVLRLLWRLFDRRPQWLDMPRWQRQAASSIHGMLYVLLFVMPLSGWLYNSASNFPLRWFGLFPVPPLAGRDEDLKELAESIHEFGFYLLAVLVVVHAAGALKHHYVDRDRTLLRMLPWSGRPPGDPR